jgi:heterodisulfide reductase subunit C
MISSIIFSIFLIAGIFLFYRNISRISRNIKLGRRSEISGSIAKRFKKLLLVAIGQSKLPKRPIAGIMHIFIYIGFILVNLELIEIIYDGIAGTHRSMNFTDAYPWLISAFEILAVLVIIACLIFLIRRNILRLNRFNSAEMTSWPKLDANIILITEIILMFALLTMNAADLQLQSINAQDFHKTGQFLISGLFYSAFSGISVNNLILIDQVAWWLHIVGILAFLNYIPYSKHFHIILAFPNVYYSKLKPLTYIQNMESVTKEVKIAMGLIKDTPDNSTEEIAFGAKDVQQLSRKSLMDAYSCTECGRCTIVCPANLTGKKLSPRKIVMDTRDRLEEYGRILRKNISISGNQFLLRNYISEEEIWACTTCNACSYECPVNIDPVAIIIELRRYMFMEESAAPSTINSMSANIENNGAPWQYSSADRDNWTSELYLNR